MAASIASGYRHPLLATLARVTEGRTRLFVTIAVGVVRHVLTVLAGVTSGWLVGSAAKGAPLSALMPGLVVLAVAVVGGSVGAWAEGWCSHAFAFRYQAKLRVLLYDGLERSAPRHLLGQRTGDPRARPRWATSTRARSASSRTSRST